MKNKRLFKEVLFTNFRNGGGGQVGGGGTGGGSGTGGDGDGKN